LILFSPGGVTNYVSVRAYDVAGNTNTLTDAFFVKKTPGANFHQQHDGRRHDLATRRSRRHL